MNQDLGRFVGAETRSKYRSPRIHPPSNPRRSNRRSSASKSYSRSQPGLGIHWEMPLRSLRGLSPKRCEERFSARRAQPHLPTPAGAAARVTEGPDGITESLLIKKGCHIPDSDL